MQANNLKCVDARHFIHLAAGDDTLPTEDQQLGEHLHGCAECRSYHAGMVDAMRAIESLRDGDVADASSGSLWPAMAGRLQSKSRTGEPQRRRFNGAVVALCACSLMLALVTAVQNLPANSVDPYANFSQGPAEAMNVSFHPGAAQRMADQPQRQLVQVVDRGGAVLLIDPVTGQQFRPQLEVTAPLPTDQRLEF